MTDEKAKELLSNLIGMVEDNQENDYDTALKIGIDAIESKKIIRCKDCVWYRGGFCNNLDIGGCDFNDFCSWGERIEDETD